MPEAPRAATIPRLSIIIPAHDNAATLPRLLASLAQAPLPVPGEVIVVTDRCCDATADVARAGGARVINNTEHPGAGGSRHLGAQRARGRTLLFLDADTTVLPDTIRAMHLRFEQHHRALALTGGFTAEPLNGGGGPRFLAHKLYYTDTVPAGQRDELYPVGAFGGGASMVDREIYFRSGGFDSGRVRYPSSGGEEFAAAWRLSRLVPVVSCPRFNVPHHFRTVGQSLPILIRRTYNYAMLLWSIPPAERRAVADSVSAGERLKLLLVGLTYGSLPFVAARLLPAPVPLGFLAGFLLAEAGFFRYLQRAEGPGFALWGLLRDWLLFTAKGLGVLLALGNRLLIRRPDHRF